MPTEKTRGHLLQENSPEADLPARLQVSGRKAGRQEGRKAAARQQGSKEAERAFSIKQIRTKPYMNQICIKHRRKPNKHRKKNQSDGFLARSIRRLLHFLGCLGGGRRRIAVPEQQPAGSRWTPWSPCAVAFLSHARKGALTYFYSTHKLTTNRPATQSTGINFMNAATSSGKSHSSHQCPA